MPTVERNKRVIAVTKRVCKNGDNKIDFDRLSIDSDEMLPT
jgi:hypothetical protein